MIRSTTTLALSVLAIAAAFAQPALAESTPAGDDAVPQATIAADHVDYTSPAAVAKLKARVRHTAYDICTAYNDGSGRLSLDERTCYNTAVHTSFADIESRRALALAQAHKNALAANSTTLPAH